MQTDDKNIGDSEPLRTYKDTTFRLLFSEKERAIELYNALTGENLPPDTELTYTTLKNAIYADRKNDLGFIINHRHLVLSEQQSSINYNMPMRCLGYVSRTLENLAGNEGLYSKKMIKIPAPEFYVFYIGEEKWGNRVLRLSESFLAEPKENSVELVVNVVNLNYNKSKEILQKSPSLLGYSKLVSYVRQEQADSGNLKTAIDTAVSRCMNEGLIDDFLKLHSREVSGMLFKELTMEEFAEIRAHEAYGDGKREGLSEGRQEGRNESKREIAKKLKSRGTTWADISEITGISLDEIESL